MALRESIIEARNRKANDEEILAQIFNANPDKQGAIRAAAARGASPTSIIDEMLKQNGGPMPAPAAPAEKTNLEKFAEGFKGEGTASGAFLNTGSEVLKGAVKGVVSTVEGASSLGEKLLRGFWKTVLPKAGEKALGIDEPMDQTSAEKLIPEDLRTPTNNAQKVGFVAEQIAEFLLPASKIVSVEKAATTAAKGAVIAKTGSKLLGGLASTAVKAGVGALSSGAIVAVQTGGDKKETRRAMIIGAAVPVALDAVKGIGSVAGQVAKWFASKMSGVPEAAIEKGFRDPQAVQAAIKAAADNGDQAVFEVYDDAVGALDDLKNVRRTAYREALDDIEGSIWTTKKGQIYIKNADDVWVPTDLGLKGVKDTITKTLKDYGATGARNSFDFTKTPLPKSYQTQLGEMVDRVYAWDDFTPTGLDDLREIIGSYEKSSVAIGQAGKADRIFNAIIGDVKRNLASYVGEKMPAIAAMNKQYAVQSEFIDDTLRYLKLESPDKSQAMRRLLNIFNPKNNEIYGTYLKQLGDKAGIDLMADVAGTLMSRWTPSGLGAYLSAAGAGGSAVAAISNPATALAIPPTLAAASPRMVGEIATKLGAASQNPAIQKMLQMLQPALQGAVSTLRRGK